MIICLARLGCGDGAGNVTRMLDLGPCRLIDTSKFNGVCWKNGTTIRLHRAPPFRARARRDDLSDYRTHHVYNVTEGGYEAHHGRLP